MRAPWLVRLGLAGGLIAAVWAFAHDRPLTPSQQTIQPADLPPASPPSTPPLSAGSDERDVIDAYGQQPWGDPSLDPEVLQRAYAPPPRSLPKAARPEILPIHPPEREWRKAQRNEDAIAY